METEQTKEQMIANRKAKLKQIFGFFLLTLPAGAMQFLSIFVFQTTLGWQYWQAFAIGYALATTWNFTINRKKTFGESVDYKKAVPRIVLFYLVFVFFAVGFTYFWGNYIPWDPSFVTWSSYIGTFIVMIVNFTSTFIICGKISRKFKKQ